MYIMIKPASGLCNLRCKYCFYTDEMNKRDQASFGIMTEETAAHVIKKTLQYAERECTFFFQGGEPTLAGLPFFKSFLNLTRKYNVNNVEVKFSLQTNGTLLNREWCEFFAENKFLIGLSVDGIKMTHDAFRKDAQGKDTYVHVMQAAQMLKDAGVEFNILTVVNAKTAPKIHRIYENYKKQGLHWQQYITCMDPIGEIQGQEDYSLLPEVYGQFLIDLYDLWEIDLKQGRQPYIRQFENYIGILLGQQPEACEQRGVCGIQNVVEADGSVYPCDFYVLDDYCLGNLVTDTFEQIDARRKELHFIERSMNHTQQCKSCPYFALCRGGCMRHREQPGTKPGENYFCRGYKMFFDSCLPRMQEIASRIRR